MVAVLNDVIMPNSVLVAGVRGKNMRQNTRTRNQGGFVDAVAVWASTLRQYELGTAPMRVSAWHAIIGLHEVTDGGAYGFLMEDPADCTCPIDAGKVTLTAGIYRLWKRYTSVGSTRFKDRKITRLKAVAIYRNGVLMTTGYTLDSNTGIVTITAPGADVFTWSGSFYVPVHFADDSIDWDLIAGGARDARVVAGPSVLLVEIRE